MKVVIVGNGMAGTALVEEILRVSADRDIRIQVFGEERYVGYNRILITDVLAGRKLPTEIYIKRWRWYEEMGVRLEVGRRVDRIFPNRKTLITEDGEVFRYDKIVIATGSRPFIPPIRGVDKKGVFTYRTLDDVFKILDLARVSRRAVVIGGGLLGIEVAKALKDIGLEVFLVHILDVLMENQLDKTASGLLKRDLERAGIRVFLSRRTEEILGESRAEGVRFEGGEEIGADLVVIATGIKPNADIGIKSGLRVNKGIVVNDFLETSASDVYAVGECIEHRGKTYGLVAPIMEQVKVCAHNLIHGNERKYEGSLTYATLKVAGIKLFSAGEFLEREGDEVVSFLDTGRSVYRKVVIRNDKIVGTILYGDITGNNQILEYMKTGKEIGEQRPYFLVKHLVPEGGTDTEELKDTDIVCNCNAVTKGEIAKAILERGAKTLEDLQRITRASTSCGSCAEIVERILREYVGERPRRVNRIEVIKKELHPFDDEFRRRMERYFEKGSWEDIPEEDRDVRLKWYGIFYRKATPGYFMIRIRVPGGRLTYEQAKVIAHLSEKFCRGEVEITSRQQIQVRWVELKNIPYILNALERVGLSTLQTGMDNVRNVTGDPLTGLAEDSLIDTLRLTKDITDVFLGKKRYADLPRKFNVAVLGSKTDPINAMYNDICLYLAERDGRIGFNVYLGGKIGSGGPVRAIDMDIFIEPHEAVDLCRVVFDIYTAFGNREDRSRNRLFFLIKEWGVERFREEIEKRLYRTLPPKGADLVERWGEREGVVNLRNGTFAVLAVVPAGKIRAEDLRRAAELSRLYGSREIRLTVYQNLYIPNVPEENLERLLRDEFFSKYKTVESPFMVHTIACAGSDTCAFGVIPNKPDAVRLARYLTDRFELDTPIRIHWSACAKGCGQHGSGDIGFVGTKTKVNGKVVLAVDLFVGGTPEREGFRILQGLPLSRVEETVECLVRFYLENREEGESFSDFARRVGPEILKNLITSKVPAGG
ncbi:MAG: FAD-dependent oxidoreductase [Aquificota bacterium]|nr:FAD-dependent oxidoreductase [Aquificota bacterium]